MPPKFKPKQPKARKAKTKEQIQGIQSRVSKEDKRVDAIKAAQQRSFALREDPSQFLVGLSDMATAYTRTALAKVNTTNQLDVFDAPSQEIDSLSPVPRDLNLPPGVDVGKAFTDRVISGGGADGSDYLSLKDKGLDPSKYQKYNQPPGIRKLTYVERKRLNEEDATPQAINYGNPFGQASLDFNAGFTPSEYLPKEYEDAEEQGDGGLSALSEVNAYQLDKNIIVVPSREQKKAVRVGLDLTKQQQMEFIKRIKTLRKQMKKAGSEEERSSIQDEIDEMEQGNTAKRRESKRQKEDRISSASENTFGRESILASAQGIKKYPGPANIYTDMTKVRDYMRKPNPESIVSKDAYRAGTSVLGTSEEEVLETNLTEYASARWSGTSNKGGGTLGNTEVYSNQLSNYIAPEITPLQMRSLKSIPDWGSYQDSQEADEVVGDSELPIRMDAMAIEDARRTQGHYR